MAARPQPAIPLIAHVVFRFDYGGLENGLINLVNRLPAARFRHAIVALDGIGEEFRRRLQRADVTVMSIDKRPGKDLPSYYRMWRTLRSLRPDVVHTRNLGTLDMQLAAMAAGVRRRVHGEHGWSPSDPQGLDPRNLRLRRLLRALPQGYVAMSRDIARWLEQSVGVPAARIRQLYSGVDTVRFVPDGPLPADLPWPSANGGVARPVIVGTVGRLDPIKNHRGLLQAFGAILERHPDWRGRVRLIIAGDGPLRGELAPLAGELGLGDSVWFPGARPDVPALMRAMDVFVLPSINEGISNTILEAMATARPVVACRTGGNPELVVDGLTGALYDPDEESALAASLENYVQQSDLRRSHGEAARRRVVEQFSLEAMVARYGEFYDDVLGRRRAA
jgi:sugar transferase (PEP-CTERM/EpsH1 system associated)